MEKTQRVLNILWVIIVCLALITANWFQIFKHLTPCPYCLFQRVSMVGIGICALMNLRFGVKVGHYGIALLFATLGLLFSFRLSPFGGHILGYSLSSWSAFVYVGSILGGAILLLLYKDSSPRWGFVEKGLFALITFLVVVDIVTVLI